MIAVAEDGRLGEVRVYGTIASDLGALEKVLRRLGGEGVRLHVVYEAGPTGYVIYRRLQQLKLACIVVAPSRTPQPKGGRQKNGPAGRGAAGAGCTGPENWRRSTCRMRWMSRSAI